MTLRLSIPGSYRPFALFNALLLLFLAGGALYLGLAARAPDLFACAFARGVHLYCPGCGGSRALYALLRFDLLGSLLAKPALLRGGATLLYSELALLGYARGGRVRALPAILFGAFLVLFFLVRNILLVAAGIDPLGDLISYWR